MKHSDLLDIFQLLKVLSLKSFGNLFGNSYIPCLLLIITIHFTCGDTKILSNIKMSQNIMARIVVMVNLTKENNNKKDWGCKFGPKLGSKLVFCHFLKFGSLVFF